MPPSSVDNAGRVAEGEASPPRAAITPMFHLWPDLWPELRQVIRDQMTLRALVALSATCHGERKACAPLTRWPAKIRWGYHDMNTNHRWRPVKELETLDARFLRAARAGFFAEDILSMGYVSCGANYLTIQWFGITTLSIVINPAADQANNSRIDEEWIEKILAEGVTMRPWYQNRYCSSWLVPRFFADNTKHIISELHDKIFEASKDQSSWTMDTGMGRATLPLIGAVYQHLRNFSILERVQIGIDSSFGKHVTIQESPTGFELVYLFPQVRTT